jgi:DNA polymerase-3 subunit epsilon
MWIQLSRPIVFFDLEATGMNISRDRIVEICLIKVHPDGSQETRTELINPGIPIPAEVTKIHGISDQDVADKPLFSAIAKELSTYLKNCDFAGFNSNKFDFPLLVEEFLRAGVEFETDNRKFIDVQRIFHTMEQRNLGAAVRFYCNREIEKAHSAEADTIATLDVFKAQLLRYENLQNDIEFLHKFSGQSNNCDLAGRIVFNDKKQEVFNFGKHKGRPVEEVLKAEPSYYEWMMNGDFPLQTKNVLTRIRLRQFGK